jgi:hypothetical protein
LAKPFDLDKTPFDVLNTRLTKTNAALGEASQALSAARGETISRRDVETGLVAVLSLDEIVDLLDRDIDAEQILSLLYDYDFARFRPETLCDITLQESIIPDGVPVGDIQRDEVGDAFDLARLRLEAIQYRFDAGHELHASLALGLVAVIVARQPILIAVDVEILRQAILDDDRFTPNVVIQEGFGQLMVNRRFDQPQRFTAP